MPDTSVDIHTDARDTPRSQLIAPIHLARSTEPCWQCHQPTEVFCLMAAAVTDVQEDDGDFYVEEYEGPAWISGLQYLDPALESALQGLAPRYTVDTSQTRGDSVRMNHCSHCGAKIGDFYLHSEPGGAFFPTSPEEEGRITFQVLANEGTFEFGGDFGLRG